MKNKLFEYITVYTRNYTIKQRTILTNSKMDTNGTSYSASNNCIGVGASYHYDSHHGSSGWSAGMSIPVYSNNDNSFTVSYGQGLSGYGSNVTSTNYSVGISWDCK